MTTPLNEVIKAFREILDGDELGKTVPFTTLHFHMISNYDMNEEEAREAIFAACKAGQLLMHEDNIQLIEPPA